MFGENGWGPHCRLSYCVKIISELYQNHFPMLIQWESGSGALWQWCADEG